MSKPEYLSDEWFDAAGARVAATPLESSSKEPIVFSYEIDGIPDGHPKAGSVVKYRIEVDPVVGTATLSQSDEPGDVRFSMAYAVAAEVAGGAVSGSRAFLDASIRLGGDVAALIERAEELRVLNGLIGPGDA
ncbi:MAG: hypothetical protein KJN63_08315 [Acidimicrobiia bacterium]|nr:hypothetical protein [Acidimicrobiia bacterium]